MTGPMMPGLGPDMSVTRQQIKRGTFKRILSYARPYRGGIALLVLVSALNAGIAVATPLLFMRIIDEGIVKKDSTVITGTTLVVVGLALLAAILGYLEAWLSAWFSEGLVYTLRTRVYGHIQRQSIAFFTRAQTGALVSRLNSDVVAAQQASGSLVAMVVPAVLTLAFVLVTMFYLSWLVTVVTLVLLPLFVLPGKIVGKRLQRLTREGMQVNAELGSVMNERFNVSGALLAKIFGRPGSELKLFAGLAGKARDVGAMTVVTGRLLFLSMTLLSALATAIVYGIGGGLIIQGAFQIGTLVALATLLARLFAPISMLANAQADAMTVMVSFDRMFEVLDLKPLVSEKKEAAALPAAEAAPDIEFDGVSFRYPKASEVSLASLEAIALPSAERTVDTWTLRDLSFVAPTGKLTALVGASGAGKTTITQLVPRLYDPTEGTIRIGGHDLKDVTLESLTDTIGIVTQDSYLFHSTIRENLTYAKPGATNQEVEEACRAAQIWDLIEALPNGLDTVVGDRGYRLSGGEKQRIAMARLLLKAPPVVVLDEATAHLDSESEAALQRALKTALAGRTSLVIAHRLSTIREADQILVIDKGQIVERGTHDELLARDGAYAELYRTQFNGKPAAESNGHREEMLEPVGPGGGFAGGPGPMFPGGPGPGGPGGPMMFPGGPGGPGAGPMFPGGPGGPGMPPPGPPPPGHR